MMREKTFLSPLFSTHGVGWEHDPDPAKPTLRRVIAMGVVKPANDDAAFWREKAAREQTVHEQGITWRINGTWL